MVRFDNAMLWQVHSAIGACPGCDRVENARGLTSGAQLERDLVLLERAAIGERTPITECHTMKYLPVRIRQNSHAAL